MKTLNNQEILSLQQTNSGGGRERGEGGPSGWWGVANYGCPAHHYPPPPLPKTPRVGSRGLIRIQLCLCARVFDVSVTLWDLYGFLYHQFFLDFWLFVDIFTFPPTLAQSISSSVPFRWVAGAYSGGRAKGNSLILDLLHPGPWCLNTLLVVREGG